MRRMILGKKGGIYGAWLSKPGIDVLTATQDQMLFGADDDRPILNFLLRGTLSLSAGANTVVPYGITLQTRPIVFLSQRDTASAFVWDCHVQPESTRIVPYPGLSSVNFVNQGGITYAGRYVIFARPQL